MSIKIDILTEWKGRQSLNSAKNDLSAFEAGAIKLGKTLGAVFAAKKIIQFANSSLHAFTADNLAAKQLALTLENLGLGFDSKRVETFIQSTEKLTGVLDEQLRPAMQLFLNTTGSVVRSQSLLNTALNISRATGKDLASVSAALARAYQGNYTSLQRLGIGVDVATMKTQGFAAVQDNLNKKFAGAAKTAADSYQGSLDKLKVAADNAKEAIGKGMVDALAAFSKSGTIDGAVSAIDKVSAALGRAIAGTGRFIAFTKEVFVNGKSATEAAADVYPIKTQPQTRGAGRLAVDLANQRAAAEKKVTDAIKAKAMADAKANQALLKQKSDQLKLDQAAAALKKSQAVFDMQAIEIAAALQNDRITADEKLRLQMMATQDQLTAAIQDQNIPAFDALIKKLEELRLAFENLGKTKIENPLVNVEEGAKNAANAFGLTLDAYHKLRAGERMDDPLVKVTQGAKDAAAAFGLALEAYRKLRAEQRGDIVETIPAAPTPGDGGGDSGRRGNGQQNVIIQVQAAPELIATVQQGIVGNTANGTAAVYSRSTTARVGDW